MFVKSIVNTIKHTDAFVVIHVGKLDADRYMDIIRNVITKRIHPQRIMSAFLKSDAQIFREKTKRYPSIQKIKDYRTQHQAYDDLLEFMSTYELLTQVPNSQQIIHQICKNAPQEAI